MNDLLDTVKMPEVTMIANVAFMVFAMIAVVRRVSRAASCVAFRVIGVASCVSARVTTMTAAALTVCSRTPSQKNHRHHWQKRHEVQTLK